MNEFYHSYNRGVEKRKIFLENGDYVRGIHHLFEFNDNKAVDNLGRNLNEGSQTSFISLRDGGRDRIIDLFTWVFMPNHYHFFSCPIVENGLTKFHQKFGTGFTNYFNTKYKRSGVLFQGRYKKVQVTSDNQALQLICYIHANPLDLWKPDWKEKGLTDVEIQEAIDFLEQYRWSSHLDWWGIKNFPSLLADNPLARFFKNPEEYRDFFIQWLKYYEKNFEGIKEFILEPKFK